MTTLAEHKRRHQLVQEADQHLKQAKKAVQQALETLEDSPRQAPKARLSESLEHIDKALDHTY